MPSEQPVSALRSHGKSATFRQHYYPEGAWGWVITICCFIVNIFTTGLQLSFAILQMELVRHCYQMAAVESGAGNSAAAPAPPPPASDQEVVVVKQHSQNTEEERMNAGKGLLPFPARFFPAILSYCNLSAIGQPQSEFYTKTI